MCQRFAFAALALLLLLSPMVGPGVSFADEAQSEAAKRDLRNLLDELLGPPTAPRATTAQSEQPTHPATLEQQPAAVPAPAVTAPAPVEERPATVVAPPSSSSGSGRVDVKGYYRKDGTYVKPHTRSAPRRR